METNNNLVVLHMQYLRLRLLAIALIGYRNHGLRKVEESLPREGLIVEGRGLSLVSILTDALHEGYLRQQGHTHLFGQSLASLLSEEVISVLGNVFRL